MMKLFHIMLVAILFSVFVQSSYAQRDTNINTSFASIELGSVIEQSFAFDDSVITAVQSKRAQCIAFSSMVNILRVDPQKNNGVIRFTLQVLDPSLSVIAVGVVKSSQKNSTLIATAFRNVKVVVKKDSLTAFPVAQYLPLELPQEQTLSTWFSVGIGGSIAFLIVIVHQWILFHKRSIERAILRTQQQKGLTIEQLFEFLHAMQSKTALHLHDIEEVLSLQLQVSSNVVHACREIIPQHLLASLDEIRFSGILPQEAVLRDSLDKIVHACSVVMAQHEHAQE